MHRYTRSRKSCTTIRSYRKAIVAMSADLNEVFKCSSYPRLALGRMLSDPLRETLVCFSSAASHKLVHLGESVEAPIEIFGVLGRQDDRRQSG